MSQPRIAAVRALVPTALAGSNEHRQAAGHWISDTKIANPMSVWPEYRETRTSWGMGAVGSVVVEVEATDGTVGFAPSVGGPAAAFIAEQHLARFVEGREVTIESIEECWEQMFRASLYYGRRGITLNTISAIDLALWDLLGRLRGEPVWQLLGGKVIDDLPMYATGPRPDIAKELGFVGGKLPLPASPAEGATGLRENLALAERMRDRCGPADDFFLAFDCYMSLDVPYTLELADGLKPLEFKWIEEFLPPDDYWGYAEVHRKLSRGILTTTGEHEATRWGFKLLLDWECADILQPDVTWCGGLSELRRIADMARERGVPIVPHGSSVYSYHFVVTRPETPFAEFLMMHPEATEIVPAFASLIVDEPLPVDGHIRVPDRPGFGVELDREVHLDRPYTH